MAYWGDKEIWQDLSPVERAAAMALLEADQRGGKIDLASARNALGAMINRADKAGQDLGDHVTARIYQPIIEDTQLDRLPRILASPEFQQMQEAAQARLSGATPDWVNGATHFLASEKTMLELEAQDPGKYRNWGPRGQNWTKFGKDPARPGEYESVVFRDSSHAFLAPEGAHSAKFGDGTAVAALQPDSPPAERSEVQVAGMEDIGGLLRRMFQGQGAEAPAAGAAAPAAGNKGFLDEVLGEASKLKGELAKNAEAASELVAGAPAAPQAQGMLRGGVNPQLAQLLQQMFRSGKLGA